MLRETLYFLCISLVQAACPTPEIDYSTNYAYNGDFELPVLASNFIYRIGSNAILDGWKTKSMELGKGFIYNPRWGNTQVIELDTIYNENYTKTIEV